MIDFDRDNCDSFQKYFAYYHVGQIAMLWCGIKPEDFDEVLSECDYIRRGVPKHPYIGCLEPRAAAVMDAIDTWQLAVGRDGKNHSINEHDHIAPERRTVLLKDFKEWLLKAFPNEKPKLIFDEIERNTHSSITIEAYQTLLADRDHLNVRISKAEDVFREQKRKLDILESKNASLRSIVDNAKTIDGKAETTYLNIIGSLLTLMLSKSPSGTPRSVYKNQTSIIDAMLAHHGELPGIRTRTLEAKFADAKRNIK